MTDKQPRQMSERSLENLKLGAQVRSQGKVRRNTTLLPETIAWLEDQGNASEAIDNLVADARNGHFSLENQQAELESKLRAAQNEIFELQSQLIALKSPAVDLEAARDRTLTSLKLGKQSPGYKSATKVLTRFIAELRSDRDQSVKQRL